MTPAEVLTAAEERLTPDTWRKAGWGDNGVTANVIPGVTECLSEALCHVDCDPQTRAEARGAVRRAITACFPDRHPSVPFFNDDSRTSLADVHTVLEEAIGELAL